MYIIHTHKFICFLPLQFLARYIMFNSLNLEIAFINFQLMCGVERMCIENSHTINHKRVISSYINLESTSLKTQIL